MNIVSKLAKKRPLSLLGACLILSGCSPRAELLLEHPPGSISLNSSQACMPMEQGEVRYVIGKMLTGIDASYRLERKATAQKEFRILVNLQFRSHDATEMELVRQNAQGCLRNLSPYLKGPEGESIEITLDETDRALPAVGVIHIDSLAAEERKTFRETSLRWSNELSCGKILHEVLHHLGLVDEYFDPGHAPCRAVGSQSSAMLSGDTAIEQAIVLQKSVLMPAHFRALTMPGCMSANQNYYRCAAVAYLADAAACPKDLPTVCSSNDEWTK